MTDLTVNEPVVLRFTAENGLSHAVTVGVGDDIYGCCGFRTSLIRPDGRRADPRPHGSADSNFVLGPGPYISVQPFATYSKLLLMNKRYKFDMPGRYILEVTNIDPPGSGAAADPPHPARVEIHVGPRDPARLQQVCAGIEATLTGAGSSEQGYTPEEALAYIDDPVAVPYLARLFERRETALAPLVTKALERIGDAFAVDALISHLSSSNEQVRLQVLRALELIEMRTTDPLVRLKIQGAWQ